MKNGIKWILIVFFFCVSIVYSYFSYQIAQIDDQTLESFRYNLWLGDQNDFCLALKFRGWDRVSCENHLLVTVDGYTLVLKHVFSLDQGEPEKPAPIVLLQPGLGDAAMTFAVSGPRLSLLGSLIDAGCDVWLLDGRGRAPYQHQNHSQRSVGFWDFSIDEKIDHDIPSSVSYILNVSARATIDLAVGHSQGALLLLAATAEHDLPIQHLVALAPPLSFSRFTQYELLPSLGKRLLSLLQTRFVVETLGMTPSALLDSLRHGIAYACLLHPNFCQRALLSIGGGSPRSTFSHVHLPEIFTFYPVATSFKNLEHYLQLDLTGVLRRFDHGEEVNRHQYLQPVPPTFKTHDDADGCAGILLSRHTHTVDLFFGDADHLVPESRYQQFIDALTPEERQNINVHWITGYGHADFVWGQDASRSLYSPIIQKYLSL